MTKPRFQFSLRRLLAWVVLANILALFAYYVPADCPLCGPLYLVKFWEPHRGLGIAWTACLVPMLLAPAVKLSRVTVLMAVAGLLLWIGSYYLILEIEAGV
ncbi:MAG: hypothetical protein NTW87_22405 [Planctomycetota bacterium]|nr:hypothetical protein [Planctomycetota bacterium]